MVAVSRGMTRSRLAVGLSALALLASSSAVTYAQAADARETTTAVRQTSSVQCGHERVPSVAPKARRHWYGGTILAVDLAALTLGIAAVAHPDASAPLAIAGSATYLLGGPIVHAVHGRTGTAFGSLGLRVGVPIASAGVGAVVGAAAQGDCSGDWCGIGAVVGGVFGFGAGMLVASVVDIAGLAYEAEPNSAGPRVALLPSIDPRRASAGLDLVGSW